MKASPPPEEEFLDIFQKIKYSLCLLVSWTWGSRVHFDKGPQGGSHLPVSLGPSAALHHAAWRATTPASRLCASWPGGSLWLLLFISPPSGLRHQLWRLSLTDGEDHWGASVGRVSGQSSYDHGGHFTASGAFDQRGKGSVESIGAQLDFALVCVLTCWCICRDGFLLILKETCSSFCQLAAQRGCSSVFSCLPGRLAASDSRLDWAASGGSHWVTA